MLTLPTRQNLFLALALASLVVVEGLGYAIRTNELIN